MTLPILDIVVIGAGHAGLSISYWLKRLQVNHLVFEKGCIGETWRNQRWDSLKLNTPTSVNLLPGQDNFLTDPDEFWTAGEFVSLLEDYTHNFQLPVHEGCEVLSVEKIQGSEHFLVSVSEKDSVKKYRCKLVIAASGFQNKKHIPVISKNISNEILQLHSSEYKNPSLLPDGAVLVIGSAQSGVQIAEDLIDAGRQIYLSTSRVGRVPRRYRGKDIVEWLILSGFFDEKTADINDPAILKARFAQVSGVGKRGHTVSLQSLAHKGAVILGKAINADSSVLSIQPDVINNIRFADDASMNIKSMIDKLIIKSGSEVPGPEEDAADLPDESGACASTETLLNLNRNKISSVIWATGFEIDLSYLKVPVVDGTGLLKHHEGISEIEGIYFPGLPWMRKRKSGVILGIREDAEFITRKIMEKYPGMISREKLSIL